jgi:hypothetical protein
MKSDVDESKSRNSGAVLPGWLWLGLPVGLALLWFGLTVAGDDIYRKYCHHELGIPETVTVVALGVAIWAAWRLFVHRRKVPSRLFGWYVLFLGAACFLFAGEEMSWGQHWLGFEPPEEIAKHNRQGELNLHNLPLLDPLFDLVARNALTLGALVGGVIIPLVRRKRRTANHDLSRMWNWIWPSLDCVPAALFACTITLPNKISKLMDVDVLLGFHNGASETKEMFLAVFLMIYLLALWKRVARGAESA